ncbi:MAG: ABC transporter, partial [Treponema sp.]|nr:ABC transporter [Treponema sp.]
AWLMREEFHTNPDVAYMMEMEAPQTRGDKILGAAMSGVFPSFFAGAPKPVREGSEEELPDMPESASPARIIVMGDVDFATNLINATQARHNLDFLLRVADWLINADDIINIRNRLPQTGRLDRITDPQRLAAAMRFSQILNVGLVPLFVIISGLFIASRRKHAMRAADKPPGDTQSSARTTDKESGNDI